MKMSTSDMNLSDDEVTHLGPADDQELIKEISNNLRKGRGHWSDWRLQAKEDFDFFAGVQWTQEDKAMLDEQGRPAVVFNRVVRTVNAVSGVELQNRQEVRYYPRKIMPESDDIDAPNDSGFADAMNDASKWVRDENNAEDEESEAFQDCLICGIGWTETRMNYDDDPQGMIVKDRIDPLIMLVDPNAKKRNFEDAKWVACIKDFPRKEVMRMFPGLQSYEGGLFWNDSDYLVHDQTNEWKYENDYSDEMTKVGMISVIQYQYWVIEPMYIVLTMDGNIIKLPQSRYQKVKSLVATQSTKVVKVNQKIYKQCFLVGKQIADKSELGCNHFTLRAITGLRDRNRNIWFGLVSLMKDPQRWANKWLSQIQHILNSNSKGGLLIEEGAVKNRQKLEEDWAKTDSIIDLNPGGLNKIQQKENIQYPDGIDRLLNYAVNAINDIPGVNLEMLGMANRDQPIGLENTRKNAGITVLASFFDSLRRYRKMDGRILAYYIREYIADGRLIRILGTEGTKYVPLIKNKLAFEYDVIVDDSPTSSNAKEKTFAMLMQVIPMALEAQIPIPKEILDYAPLPTDLVQKWKKQIAEQEQPPQPDPVAEQLKQIQMLSMQLDLAKKKADIGKTESETVKNYATAEKEHSVGQEQSALAMQKFGVLHHDQSLKAHAMEQDQTRKDLALILDQHRKMLEVELDAQLRRESRIKIPSLAEIH